MKTLLPFLALAACSPAPDSFVQVADHIYVQQAELDRSGSGLPLWFIIRIDPKTVEFYSVSASIMCKPATMRIYYSDHYRNGEFLSRGTPPAKRWYPIPSTAPASKLWQAVCKKTEQV